VIDAEPAVVHAVKKTINGPRAVCGAGRIDRMVAGRFDPADRQACDRCVGVVAPTG